MRKFRLVLVVGGILALSSAAYVWFFVYNKPHRNIERAEPDAEFRTEDFLIVMSGPQAQDYFDKVVILNGAVLRMERTGTANSIVLGGADLEIYCEMLPKYSESAARIGIGDPVRVKGLLTGMVDAFEGIPGTVYLVKCSIIN